MTALEPALRAALMRPRYRDRSEWPTLDPVKVALARRLLAEKSEVVIELGGPTERSEDIGDNLASGSEHAL